MSIILFVIGAGIGLVGSIKLGTFEAEGMRVRVAGFVLCIPLLLSQMLYVLAGAAAGGDSGLVGLVAFLELIGMGAAAAVAYWLLMLDSEGVTPVQRPRPTIQPRQPRDNAPKRRDHPLSKTEDKPEETKAEPLEPKRPAAVMSGRAPRKRRDFPLVMTTTEAANYLEMDEDDLLELIESGQIAASRINYRYRISRTVLDEFIEEQQKNDT